MSEEQDSDSRDRQGGVPVVFIHGVGDSGSAWGDIVACLRGEGLEREYVTYDLRGHGSSANPTFVSDIWDFVSDLLAVVDSRGIDEFDLVGFSLGGLIAQGTAIRCPERVRRLVVMGAVAGRTAEERKRALARFEEIQDLGPLGVAERSVERWHPAEYLAEHPEVRERTLARFAALNPGSYAAAYKVLATTDLADKLDRIQAPTLAIAAEGDVGSPPRMSKLIAERTRGRAVVIDGIKHGGIMHLRAGEVARHIAEHLVLT
jgi:pimeloyl-ACP methyl ester carboxylesterase